MNIFWRPSCWCVIEWGYIHSTWRAQTHLQERTPWHQTRLSWRHSSPSLHASELVSFTPLLENALLLEFWGENVQLWPFSPPDRSFRPCYPHQAPGWVGLGNSWWWVLRDLVLEEIFMRLPRSGLVQRLRYSCAATSVVKVAEPWNPHLARQT